MVIVARGMAQNTFVGLLVLLYDFEPANPSSYTSELYFVKAMHRCPCN